MIFWRLTGLGISSRFADRCLDGLGSLQILAAGTATVSNRPHPESAQYVLKDRIAAILNSPCKPDSSVKPMDADDVYLYQSGMAAIYYLHRTLLRWRGTQSVVFGFPYELTLKMLETYGPGVRFFAFATSKELEELQAHLEAQRDADRNVQAIWCECPSNPLLRTPDLRRLRTLANQYGAVLVVDETIGGFANLDLLDIADILVTSLTKSFSGYSNVMGGSVILNPSGRHYTALKALFRNSYRNGLFGADAVQLEKNSRDFYQRTSVINLNTQVLVDYFRKLVADPMIPIIAVYHPSTCWSFENYRRQMRASTEDFQPGCGGVFTLEFASIAAATAFFDASCLHKGPSLGANVTLLQPYVQTVFFKEKSWAAQHGLDETIVRVSVGLEDHEVLLKAFKEGTQKMFESLGQAHPPLKLRELDQVVSSCGLQELKSGTGKENGWKGSQS